MDDTQCVVILDTNLLHCVRLYLAYAEGGRQRFPYNNVQWNKTERDIGSRVGDEKVKKALIAGGQVLHFMQSNAVEFIRSPAVEAELFRLEASSRALRNAVGQRG